jgi:hypothetical protein
LVVLQEAREEGQVLRDSGRRLSLDKGGEYLGQDAIGRFEARLGLQELSAEQGSDDQVAGQLARALSQ